MPSIWGVLRPWEEPGPGGRCHEEDTMARYLPLKHDRGAPVAQVRG